MEKGGGGGGGGGRREGSHPPIQSHSAARPIPSCRGSTSLEKGTFTRYAQCHTTQRIFSSHLLFPTRRCLRPFVVDKPFVFRRSVSSCPPPLLPLSTVNAVFSWTDRFHLETTDVAGFDSFSTPGELFSRIILTPGSKFADSSGYTRALDQCPNSTHRVLFLDDNSFLAIEYKRVTGCVVSRSD